MIKLDDVTLISVACVRVERTLKALKFSKKNIEFGSVKLLTNETITDDEIEIIKIEKLDYEGYNKFIIYDLHKFVNTNFVLIIQDDGFVVNPKKWNDVFLNYDYIGAPWPLPKDTFSYRDKFGNLVRVGNGGFSLRSKKLLSLAEKLKLEWKDFYGFYNEDGFITCHNRHFYEENGCVFAPIEIASLFSHETEIPETQGIIPFGFHGKNNSHNTLI
jgi:hypothetical protein